MRACLFVHVYKVVILRCTVTIPHAVVTGEVRRGFGWCQHIITGDCQARIGHVDFDKPCAELLIFVDRLPDRVTHIGVQALAKELLRQPDSKPFDVVVERTDVIRYGGIDRGRIPRVKARHHGKQRCRIFDAACQHAALVERARERNHAKARNAPVAGLEARDSTKRRGLAHRSAGVGTGRRRCQPGGDRSRRAARAATRHRLLVPGIANGAVVGRLVRRTHGKLVHIRLAEYDRTGLVELLDHRRIVRRDEVGKDLGATGGQQAIGAENVFVRDRNAD